LRAAKTPELATSDTTGPTEGRRDDRDRGGIGGTRLQSSRAAVRNGPAEPVTWRVSGRDLECAITLAPHRR